MMLPGLFLSAAFAQAAASAPACVLVEGDRILAADLVSVWPELAVVPAGSALGYAPVPGARRLFGLAELRRAANRFGLPQPRAGEICVERPMEALTKEKLLAAMRAAPEFASAQIEILDFSRHLTPRGEIVFRRTGLGSLPGGIADAPVVWKGYVCYAERRRAGIWARVRISLLLRRVVAVESLRAGLPISESQVRLEAYEGCPPARPQIDSVERVVGRVLKRSMAAGSVLLPDMLEAPREVQRGDTLEVEARSGAARVAILARAETSGRRGETISVRNPETGKIFAARLEAKGKAVALSGVVR